MRAATKIDDFFGMKLFIVLCRKFYDKVLTEWNAPSRSIVTMSHKIVLHASNCSLKREWSIEINKG